MSGISFSTGITNIFGAVSMQVGLSANRPAVGTYVGQFYWSSDTGTIERWNGTTWEAYGSGGGGSVPVITITYADFFTAYSGAALINAATYIVTDWPVSDTIASVYIKATSTSTIDPVAVCLLYMPNIYQAGPWSGGTSAGVFDVNNLPGIGEFVVWGARVWECIASPTTAINQLQLNPAEFTAVPVTTADAYIQLPITVLLRPDLTFISGTDPESNTIINSAEYAYNQVVFSDWNITTISAFTNNTLTGGILNNIGFANIRGNVTTLYGIVNNAAVPGSAFVNNNFQGYANNRTTADVLRNIGGYYSSNDTGGNIIRDNKISNTVDSNSIVGELSNNNATNIDGNSGSRILQNVVTGGIIQNNCVSGIAFNFCQGIASNDADRVESNVVHGSINNNTLNPAQGILNNFAQSISSNTVGPIAQNNCTGQISSNDCRISQNFGRRILRNTCASGVQQNFVQSIADNSCSLIQLNSSLDISNNSNTGTILRNNCTSIGGNTNAGAINDNICNAISTNNNTGDITNNKNNGDIIGMTAVVTNVVFNNNNGSIFTPVPGVISDPVVNK